MTNAQKQTHPSFMHLINQDRTSSMDLAVSRAIIRAQIDRPDVFAPPEAQIVLSI